MTSAWVRGCVGAWERRVGRPTSASQGPPAAVNMAGMEASQGAKQVLTPTTARSSRRSLRSPAKPVHYSSRVTDGPASPDDSTLVGREIAANGRWRDSNLGLRALFFSSVLCAVVIDLAYLLLWALLVVVAHACLLKIDESYSSPEDPTRLISILDVMFQFITAFVVLCWVVGDATSQIHEIWLHFRIPKKKVQSK